MRTEAHDWEAEGREHYDEPRRDWRRNSRFYVIRPGDVEHTLIRAFGKVWRVDSFLGRVLPQDVGKRVYLVGGILQVESREQFEKRQSAQVSR